MISVSSACTRGSRPRERYREVRQKEHTYYNYHSYFEKGVDSGLPPRTRGNTSVYFSTLFSHLQLLDCVPTMSFHVVDLLLRLAVNVLSPLLAAGFTRLPRVLEHYYHSIFEKTLQVCETQANDQQALLNVVKQNKL